MEGDYEGKGFAFRGKKVLKEGFSCSLFLLWSLRMTQSEADENPKAAGFNVYSQFFCLFLVQFERI